MLLILHKFNCYAPMFSPQVWDVTMQDLTSGSLTLDSFKAVVFVGGFSYADVLGSAKGKTLKPSVRHLLGAKSLFCNASPLLSQVGLLLLHLTPRPKLSLNVSGSGATP